ncbi:hypothetical protein ACFL53_04315 [Pseudomonadota bacterium]
MIFLYRCIAVSETFRRPYWRCFCHPISPALDEWLFGDPDY